MKFRLIPALLLTAWVARAQTPDAKAAQVPATPGTPAATISPTEATGSDPFLISAKYTNAVVRLPGAEDGKIAQTFALLLSKTHYTRHRFDDEISARFFDRYLEIWDPQKLFLLQSDFDEFVPLRTQLDELILRHSDTAPAYDIFNRFLQRFDQCYALVMARPHPLRIPRREAGFVQPGRPQAQAPARPRSRQARGTRDFAHQQAQSGKGRQAGGTRQEQADRRETGPGQGRRSAARAVGHRPA
jgi:hypothetical protein